MRLTIKLLTPEELIDAVQKEAARTFLPRRCGKRFVVSMVYQLNRLLVLEKENVALQKKLDELERKESSHEEIKDDVTR